MEGEEEKAEWRTVVAADLILADAYVIGNNFRGHARRMAQTEFVPVSQQIVLGRDAGKDQRRIILAALLFLTSPFSALRVSTTRDARSTTR